MVFQTLISLAKRFRAPPLSEFNDISALALKFSENEITFIFLNV